MNRLLQLLGVEAPANTTLQSLDVAFRGGVPFWLAILVLLSAGVLAFLLYRNEAGRLGPGRRVVLVFLRTALYAILLMLLLRPVLNLEYQGERPRGVALLLDDSQSLKQRDRRLSQDDKARVALALGKVPMGTRLGAVAGDVIAAVPSDPSRLELSHALLSHPDLRLVEKLAEKGPVRPLFVGASARPLEFKDGPADAKAILARQQAEQPTTALADAIAKVAQAKDGDPPAAIVVFSDGRDNSSKISLAEAGVEAAKAGVPVHVVALGSDEAGLLQLREVAAADTLFADDLALVPIRWRLHGFTQGTVEIRLKLGDREVARKDVTVRTGDDLRETLSFTVPKSDLKEETVALSAEIRLKGNDAFVDAMTRSVRVVDRKIRVLYVENAPRWEYKFLQPAMIRDRRIEADFILLHADPKVAKGGPPFLSEFPPTREKFFDAKYNLIILGDVPPNVLGKEKLEWIREFVENRGGLIVLSGRQHMPRSYAKSPLAEVLPVEFIDEKGTNDPDLRSQEYQPTLTDAGQRSDIMALADTPEENGDIWTKQLPGFFWNYPIAKLRPAATPLLVNPRAKLGDQPMPLFVSHYYGRGQVLFLGTDETWRWRWNHGEKFFVRFWGQMIYQLGLPTLLGDGGKRVQVALDRSQAVLGRPGQIHVRLLDKEFRPRTEPTIEGVLESPDARGEQTRSRKITLHAATGKPGEYVAMMPHDQPGRFEFKIDNPETHVFTYRVEPPPRHELEESGMNESELRQLAEGSGGRLFREETIQDLPSSIEAKTTTFTRRQEVLLWNPLAFLAFLALITAEWIVRKMADLS